MTTDELLPRLDRVRKSGRGHSARCPGHHDKENSLGVWAGDKRWFVKCFRGCAEGDILAALGLVPADVWYEPAGGGTVHKGTAAGGGPAGKQAVDALAWLAEYTGVPPASIAALPVTDAPGGIVVFTFGPGAPSKQRVAGERSLLWQPAGAPAPPLWPVPEASLPETLWLCEGETDTIVARHLGLPAYALTKGAGSPLSADQAAELLRRGARQAVIVFDADQAGRDGAAKLADVLTGAGLGVATVDLTAAGIVDPLAGGKDLRDAWRAAQAQNECAERLRQRLEAAVAEVEPVAAGAGAVSTVSATGAEPSWPVLRQQALYGLAGDVVRTLDPHTEADPAAILLSFLAAFGNAAGNGPHYIVSETRHELRIWPVLVGATSKGRKGTSWAPVKALLQRADPEWAEKHLVSGLSSGEGLIWAVRDEVVKRERVKEGNEWVYADVVTDPGVDDKRLLVMETEFTSPMKLMVREGNILSTVLRQAWDDGTLRTLVKTNPAKATGAHVTVVGHAVAEEVRRYLYESEVAGGFANRFLWACVRRSKLLPNGGRPDSAALDDLAAAVRKALDSAATIGLLTRDADAQALWDDVYGGLSSGGVGMAGAVCARCEAQVLRLSAVYALLDGSALIRVPHLLAALALWDYCEASARWIFGDRLGDAVADTILEALRGRAPEGLDRTSISALLGRHVKAAQISEALRRLLSHGAVVKETVETGGRPAEVWRWVGG